RDVMLEQDLRHPCLLGAVHLWRNPTSLCPPRSRRGIPMGGSRSSSYRGHALRSLCEYSRCGAKMLRPDRLNLGSLCAICVVLLALLLEGCSRSSKHEPVTLSIVDQQWTTENFHRAELQELAEFTRETGIQVKYLPAPESAG